MRRGARDGGEPSPRPFPLGRPFARTIAASALCLPPRCARFLQEPFRRRGVSSSTQPTFWGSRSMKTTLVLSALVLAVTSLPAPAQDFVLPSGPPRNAMEQRLQDRVDTQIQINRERGFYSPGQIRRQERYERRQRAERRWEREDRRRWEREERRRERW